MSDDQKPTLWQPTMRVMALTRVEELLLQGYGPRSMLPLLSAEGYTESLSTARDWCSEVNRQWAEEEAEFRAARRDMWRARLEARYRMMVADLHATYEAIRYDEAGREISRKTVPVFTGFARAKLYDSIAKLELLAFRLDGLDSPIVVKHEGIIDVRTMAPDQRRDRIDELLAKRNRLLSAGN